MWRLEVIWYFWECNRNEEAIVQIHERHETRDQEGSNFDNDPTLLVKYEKNAQ